MSLPRESTRRHQTLDDRTLERLRLIGQTNESELAWWRMVAAEGETLLQVGLAQAEEKFSHFHTWYPHLREFESARRATNPVPDAAGFTTCERAEFEIIRERLPRYAGGISSGVRTRPTIAVRVVKTTPPGLTAAFEAFQGLEIPPVVLTVEESDEFFGRVLPGDAPRDWFEVWECVRRDGVDGDFFAGSEHFAKDFDDLPTRFPLEPNETYWSVYTGSSGWDCDLFAWNGHVPRPLGRWYSIEFD